jgi:hypothetical protein
MKQRLNSKVQIYVLAPIVAAFLFAGAAKPASLVDSAADKLDYIHRNGGKPHPDSRPTQLAEAEANAYLASGKVKLPAGVQSVRLTGDTGAITANCRIDFDQVKTGGGSSNPLLHLFSGVHEVLVAAEASGFNYQGHVHVNSVSIDGVEVPQFVLELFVEKYVTPKYPGVGLDSTFRLPDKVETATVGSHELTVVQR